MEEALATIAEDSCSLDAVYDLSFFHIRLFNSNWAFVAIVMTCVPQGHKKKISTWFAKHNISHTMAGSGVFNVSSVDRPTFSLSLALLSFPPSFPLLECFLNDP